MDQGRSTAPRFTRRGLVLSLLGGALLGPVALGLASLVDVAVQVVPSAVLALLPSLAWLVLPFLVGVRLRDWWWPPACLVLPVIETVIAARFIAAPAALGGVVVALASVAAVAAAIGTFIGRR